MPILQAPGCEPVSGCGYSETVIIMLPEGDLKRMVVEVVWATKLAVCEADCPTDLIAIPCFLAIVDPVLLKLDEWNDLCVWLGELDDPDFKVLLVQPSPYLQSLPAQNRWRSPQEINEQYLKLLMLQLRSKIARRRSVAQKKERQILRLMYILHGLDTTSRLRLQDAAREFDVTLRTLQRDLELLKMVGFIIEPTNEPGVYRFPAGYRAYNAFYE